MRTSSYLYRFFFSVLVCIQRASVLPHLRREFAINAGTRNYAAPGRATSPERDGLHRVPRCDDTSIQDREMLDTFLADHHRKFGRRPPQEYAELSAGSFPLRPTGCRVATTRNGFEGHEQSGLDSGGEFDDLEEEVKRSHNASSPVLTSVATGVASCSGDHTASCNNADYGANAIAAHSVTAIRRPRPPSVSPNKPRDVSGPGSQQRTLPRGVHVYESLKTSVSTTTTPPREPTTADVDDRPLSGGSSGSTWRPNMAACDNSWKSFTGHRHVEASVVIATREPDTGTFDRSPSTSPVPHQFRDPVPLCPGRHGTSLHNDYVTDTRPSRPMGRGQFFAVGRQKAPHA